MIVLIRRERQIVVEDSIGDLSIRISNEEGGYRWINITDSPTYDFTHLKYAYNMECELKELLKNEVKK